jgi:hypothetical protein
MLNVTFSIKTIIMRSLFPLIVLVFFFYSSSAQTKMEYGDFIQFDNKIQWAMESDNYFDLIPKIPKYSITDWYLKKLRNTGIVSYQKNADGFSLTRSKLTRKGWNTGLSLDTVSAKETFDERFYQAGFDPTTAMSNCLCDSCYKPGLFDIAKVKQIVYYKSGKFYIINILLTSMCLKEKINSEDNGSFSWYNLFNVAFNNNPSVAPNKNMIYIGTIEKSYNFSPDANLSDSRKLLTAKSQGIMTYVNKDYQKGLFSINDPNTGKKIKDKTYFTLSHEIYEVPVYDSLGEQVGYKKVKPELNLDSFYNFKITQDVYFDTKKEVLVSKIKNVTVQKKVITSSGVYLGLTNFAILNYDKMQPVGKWEEKKRVKKGK